MSTTTNSIVPATFNNSQVFALTNPKGKECGTRVIFGGTVKAGDVRKALKTANPKMKGSELTLKVNECITGKNTVAWAEMQVAIEGMRSAGYTPDHADVRKAGGCVRFVKPVAPKAPKATDTLAKENEELKARLAKLEAAMLK